MSYSTGVFIDECPKCGYKQEAPVGYMSHCQKCGADWRSYRMPGEPIIRFHEWFNVEGEYIEFTPIKPFTVKDILHTLNDIAEGKYDLE
jgi:hypothetical protein